MVKTAPKRNSEGDLPITQAKQRMAIIEEFDDESHTEGDFDDDGLFVAKVDEGKGAKGKEKKKSRKSEPIMRDRDAGGEYEEDRGRNGSIDFLANVTTQLAKQRNKVKAKSEFKESLHKKIEESEAVLKQRIEELSELSANRDQDFSETFKSAYNMSRPLAQEPDGPMAFASLFARSQGLAEKAFRVMDEFEKVNQLTIAMDVEQLIDINTWKRENGSMQHMIDTGHDYGLAKYEAMLTDGDEPELDNDDVQAVNHVYGKLDEDTLGVGWGKMAKAQEKAARKILKANSMALAETFMD